MWKIEPPLQNKAGVLHIGNVSTIKLGDKFGTPLYVTDENRIRENYSRISESFKKNYQNFSLNYAIKANNNLSVLKILKSMGSGADCSCKEEIMLAKKTGFPPSDIIYTGNYNSDQELKYALQNRVIINLDDISLLPKLLQLGIPKMISFRVNPGLGKGRYSGLVFGGKKTKFGIGESDVIKGYELAKKAGVTKFGIHMMAGSAILDVNYFRDITEKLLVIAGKIVKKVGIEFEFVNLGGGFGISYRPRERDLNIVKVGKEVGMLFKRRVDELSLGNPTLMIEPGRYIVGDSTILLAKVHSIKRVKGRTTYVGTDAGMNTLLRPALYGAYHQTYVANRLDSKRAEIVNICGQICENTDIIAEYRKMSRMKEGDLIAVLNAGAYGFAMSSQYNSRPRAAEVLVRDGITDLIRKRETVSDLVRHQTVPGRLGK